MQATHDRILLKAIEEPTETTSGLALVPQKSAGTRKMQVISTGYGKLLDSGIITDPSVSEGDTVLIGEHSGSEFQNADGTFWAIRDDEILAVLE